MAPLTKRERSDRLMSDTLKSLLQNWDLGGMESVPPRGSGWVRSVWDWKLHQLFSTQQRLRTHPLSRGGT